MAILIANNWGFYDKPFKYIGHTVREINTRSFDPKFLALEIIEIYDANKLDLIVFTGGSDINPALYGEEREVYTDRPDIERDSFEKNLFEICKELHIPMVGICRGAQLLCALNGGKLYQNVSYHRSTHPLYTRRNSDCEHRVFDVSSTHHQMMRPNWKDAYLLAWAQQNSFKDDRPEPEVVWWPGTNSLAVQYHPEFMSETSAGFVYFTDLVKCLLANGELDNV